MIRDVVAPAYARLLTMIRDEYLTKARTTLAATAMPDGQAFYQAQIEKHTTLTLTPQQIHDIGLKEVARIQAEMEATKNKANFKGTMAEFFTFLRTDPQFYAKTPRELLSYSAYVAKKADGKLERDDWLAAAAPARHPSRARCAGADLHRGTRRARGVPDEHLQPAGAPALHARVADAARVHAGSQLSGGARARRARASGRSATRRRSRATAKGGASTPSGWAPSWGSTRRRTRTSAG